MANICDVCYKCVGDSKEIESLYNVLQSMNKPDAQSLENDYGNMWLGNLVHKLGGDWRKYRCRGEITKIVQESPFLQGWDELFHR